MLCLDAETALSMSLRKFFGIDLQKSRSRRRGGVSMLCSPALMIAAAKLLIILAEMVAAAEAQHETKGAVVVEAAEEGVPKVHPTRGRRSMVAMDFSYPV